MTNDTISEAIQQLSVSVHHLSNWK